MLKRVLAIAGIAILLSMYLITLVSSFFNSSLAFEIFRASVVCTVVVPVLIYGLMMFHKLTQKKRDKK